MTDASRPKARRLLIVGKDLEFAGLARRIAEARGLEADHISNVPEGFEPLGPSRYDLILIDIPPAEITAGEFIAKMRQAAGDLIPFIAVASKGAEIDPERMLKLGARDCLIKDERLAMLLPAALDRALADLEKELWLETSLRELRQREQALRGKEDLLQLLAENITDLISRHTARGKILYATPSVEKLLGYTQEELTGKPVESLLLPEDVEPARRRIRQVLLAGKSGCRLEFRMLQKSGRQVWVETNVRFSMDGGRLREIHCATRDVTERKRAEEERHKLEIRMRHAQKMESLGVLAGGIAHDFNNLLAAILGNAELASLEIAPASPIRENLYRVIQAAHRASQLVGQMQVYSGQGRFLVQMLDLADIARESVRPPAIVLSPIITLEMEFGAGVPPVQGDPLQIRQMLANLLANAAEALGDQEGTIRIATGVMDCDRAFLQGSFCDENLPEGTYAYVEVADNGSGMTAEVQMKMFEPFFTTKFAGRGLGLAAVLGIMRAHSGAIKVASAPGQGSVFRLMFPAAVSMLAERGPVSSSVKSWRGSGTVMVVDDEENARATVRKHLARLGFLVTTAVDGPHALDIFRKAPGEFVCVVVDDAMPNMSGRDTFHALRRIRGDIKVILSAAGGELESARQFALREQIGFIEKPCCLETLQQALQKIIEG